MIATEIKEIKGKQFLHTYSTLGYPVERDGVLYGEAYDLPDSANVYTEVIVEEDATENDYKAALAKLGVKV